MRFDVTIVVRGDCTQTRVADALFEAFDDDPAISSSGQLSYIDISVEAESLGRAVVRGLDQFLATGTGLEPVDILTGSAMTLDRMAELLPFGYERLRQLQRGDQGPGGFPRPIISNGQRVQVWNWEDVRAWLIGHGLVNASEVPDSTAETGSIEMIRAALRLGDRVVGETIDPDVREFVRTYLTESNRTGAPG